MPKKKQWVDNRRTRLFVITEGSPDAPPIVLVHGYPDNHSVWDGVAGFLKEHFFVIRYDVRGAGRSSKPRATADYRMALLASDLEAVVEATIPGQAFHLAAHDWGSIQSWESVTAGPLSSRVLSYTTISGPCLDHAAFWLRDNAGKLKSGGTRKVLRQLASSWYVILFQFPVVPEVLWGAGLDRLWPGYLKRQEQVTDTDSSTFLKSDGSHGVKLYRANFVPKLLRPRQRTAQCPVQLIVPLQDRYVGQWLFEGLERWAARLYRREIDAPHWVLLTQPERIAKWIESFARNSQETQRVP